MYAVKIEVRLDRSGLGLSDDPYAADIERSETYLDDLVDHLREPLKPGRRESL